MLVLIIAAAIFATDFVIMVLMSVIFQITVSTFALIVLNASILVLVISPILLLPKKRIEDAKNSAEKLNRVLRVMREVNHIIIKENDLKAMIFKSCMKLREVRGYFQITIAFYDGEKLKKVVESGTGGFLDRSEDIPPCIERVIKLNEAIFVKSSVVECDECSYKNHFPHSTALIPFNTQERRMLMAVFASENQFDEEEIGLLKEIANDIGFAMDKFRAEKAVYESERRYRLLAENVQDIIWTMDENLRLTYISPSVEKILGYTVEEAMNTPLDRLMTPESYKIVVDTYKRSLQEIKEGNRDPEASRTLELEFYHKNGNRVWVETKTNAIPYTNTFKIIGVTRDISERKKADEEIRKFKTLVDNANYGVAIADINGNLLYINRYFAEIHGYRAEELIGKNLSIFHNEEQLKDVMRINKLLIEEGSYSAMEVWHMHKDGSVFPMLMNGVVIKDDRGKPLYIAATAIDITESKKMNDALQESEQKYRTTFEHTGTAMIVIEEDTTISTVNSEFERLSGYRKDEIEGKISWTKLVHPDDLKIMKKYHLERRRNKGVPNTYEFRAIDKNGNIRNVLLTIGMIPGTSKSVASIIDITNMKKLHNLVQVLSEINEVVAREKNPETVLKAVCDKLNVLYSGVFVVQQGNPGDSESYLSGSINLNFIENALNSCPAVLKTIKNGEFTKIKMGDVGCNKCSEIPHKYILSFPLIHEGNQYGVIGIISNFDFDENETTLLKRLSSNIAFALSSYANEESRKVAVEQLVANLIQFETSADKLRNPLAIIIISTLELMDEMNTDDAIKIIREYAYRLKKELDEMRKEEIKTFEITEDYLVKED
jgi:PAS domain S-box-containing protein